MSAVDPRERRCPTCKRSAAARDVNPAFPFCSRRCQMVDLGRWLGEDYRVADEEPAPPAHGDGESDESSP